MRCKKLILGFIVSLVSFVSYGQLQNGAAMFGFDFRYYRSTTDYYYADGSQAPDDVQSYDFALSPTAGFFVSDHFLVGLSLEWTKQKNYNEGSVFNPESTGKNLGIAPFARYYHMFGDQFGLFIEGGFTWAKGEQRALQYDPFLGAYITTS